MQLFKFFEIALVVLTLGSGLVLLVDRFYWRKRRLAGAGLLDDGSEPALLDWSRSFFPVLAVVLVVRSFIAEPYRIPSSSMMPNLLIGDFILVNKFSYGLRLPITNTKFIPTWEPERGDVVVFKPPHDPDQNWIKRIVGLPGDRVGFHGNTLYLNGEPVSYQLKGRYIGQGPGADMTGKSLLVENLPGRTHTVLEDERFVHPFGQGDWVVPEGQYFVMGDNRDHSEDSRFWTQTSFLPDQLLRGKAFVIWLNCQDWFCKGSFDASRIGTRIQ